MRGTKTALALLAAGTLALGTGSVFAAESSAPAATPAKPSATEMSKTTAPMTNEAKESKTQQQAARTSKNTEKEVGVDRIVRGEVTHVESTATPPTLTVRVKRGKQTDTVGVDVPSTAKITEGKATKTLADIKVGDRVWMRYDRTSNGLVADQIHILGMPKVAKNEKGESYAKKASAASKTETATPAASKTETSK